MLPPIVLVLMDTSWWPSLLVVQYFLVWMWVNLCPCDQKYPFGSSLKNICSSLFLIFLQIFEVCAPCFLFNAGSGLQWRMLESCWTLSVFYLRKLAGQWHHWLRNMQVPGCLVQKQNCVVLLLHDWLSGILPGLHSNYIPLVTCYTLTRKIF